MNATVPQPDTSRKFFTLDEANRTLPLVKAIVEDIVTLYRGIRERRDRLAALSSAASRQSHQNDLYSEEVEEMEASVYQDIDRLQEFIAELTQLGVELKDPLKGSVEYPGLLDGREISLCWQFGEKQISHWHEVDAESGELQTTDTLPRMV